MSIRSLTTLLTIFLFVGTSSCLAANAGSGRASMQRSSTQFRSAASGQQNAYRYNNQHRYQEQNTQQVREQTREQKRIQDPALHPEAAGDQIAVKEMTRLRSGEHVDSAPATDTSQ